MKHNTPPVTLHRVFSSNNAIRDDRLRRHEHGSFGVISIENLRSRLEESQQREQLAMSELIGKDVKFAAAKKRLTALLDIDRTHKEEVGQVRSELKKTQAELKLVLANKTKTDEEKDLLLFNRTDQMERLVKENAALEAKLKHVTKSQGILVKALTKQLRQLKTKNKVLNSQAVENGNKIGRLEDAEKVLRNKLSTTSAKLKTFEDDQANFDMQLQTLLDENKLELEAINFSNLMQ